jgi:hypothetical protein
MSKRELWKHYKDLKTISSVGEDWDVDCYGLFQELQMLSSTAPSDVHNIKDMFKVVIRRKIRSVCHDVFMPLTIILSIPVTTAPLETSFSRSPWCSTR